MATYPTPDEHSDPDLRLHRALGRLRLSSPHPAPAVLDKLSSPLRSLAAVAYDHQRRASEVLLVVLPDLDATARAANAVRDAARQLPSLALRGASAGVLAVSATSAEALEALAGILETPAPGDEPPTPTPDAAPGS